MKISNLRKTFIAMTLGGCIAVGGIAPAHAISPTITCKFDGANTTCNVLVPGGYCGSSRMVGVGITTAKRGGIIVEKPKFQNIRWAGGKTESHKITVGTSLRALVTLEGRSNDKPYVTCSDR